MKDDVATVQLTRMIIETETKSKTKTKQKKQMKSICKVNGQLCTLKALKMLVTPLIAIVDAPKAAAALSKPKVRMDILDTSIDPSLLIKTRQAKRDYRLKRLKRESIEQDLANRILPSSFTSADGDNVELLRHWIDEIDEFENRINSFQDSILSSEGTASLLREDEPRMEGEQELLPDDNSFATRLKQFADCSWVDDATTNYETTSVKNSCFSGILELRDGVKQLDDQLITAQLSCDLLSSLSTDSSVAYALEKSRNNLFDLSGENSNSDIERAAEKSHDLLNKLEDALNQCTKFMEDDSDGLLSSLNILRQSIHLSVEEVDAIIADWSFLSRKHGINTFSLPSLQRSLQLELNGNVEATLELPKAKSEEQESLTSFEALSNELSRERLGVALNLSHCVTGRMKSLGMEGSTFEVNLKAGVRSCTDSAAFAENSILGIDSVDFLLLHRQIRSDRGSERRSQTVDEKNNETGGNLEIIGSSGEKARILLAIETDFPGAVGACCGKIPSTSISSSLVTPVAIVYDEIDAHVGGRAAVALAKLLADQTRSSSDDRGKSPECSKRGQILSITHCPSVAAVADHHVIIQKLPMSADLGGRVEVVAKHVVGSARREELARMASGDLASYDEGLRFAEALLKQGSLHKDR